MIHREWKRKFCDKKVKVGTIKHKNIHTRKRERERSLNHTGPFQIVFGKMSISSILNFNSYKLNLYICLILHLNKEWNIFFFICIRNYNWILLPLLFTMGIEPTLVIYKYFFKLLKLGCSVDRYILSLPLFCRLQCPFIKRFEALLSLSLSLSNSAKVLIPAFPRFLLQKLT